MKRESKTMGRRALAVWLAFVIIFMSLMPSIPKGVQAVEVGDTIAAYDKDFHHYCIDDGGALINGDRYQYILPSQSLSNKERAIVFWSTLSLQYGFGNMQNINRVVDKINSQAPGMGLPQIKPIVTEEDLKKIIHVPQVRAKYKWLDAVLANEEEYLQMAGLMGASGNLIVGGGTIPEILQGHTSPSTALVIDKNNFTLQFDSGGANADFIEKAVMEFSQTGEEGSYTLEPTGGWSCLKTSTSIIFSNPNPEPQQLMIRFKTEGTPYQSDGVYASLEELYEKCLQIWVCVECSGAHKQAYRGKAPLENHQRLAFVELEEIPISYYASLASTPVGSMKGSMEFQCYRHEEDFTSAYNLQLYKYDHETGKPLEGAVFNLYERFDDQSVINKTRDGAEELYEGDAPYKSYHKDNPATWEDFRFVSFITTDKDGHAQKTVNHGYHYDKTFCDGHPAPRFGAVPEEESDEETGEPCNEAEVEAAQNENRYLAGAWLNCYQECEEKSQGEFSGVHFHWLMDAVDMSRIGDISLNGGSPGSVPSGGTTISASGDMAFTASGCEADVNATYEKFIGLRYSYTFRETAARTGYTLHGNHGDDLPIEVITTDSSENGANACFAGEYAGTVDTRVVSMQAAREVLSRREEIESYRVELPKSAEEEIHVTEKEPISQWKKIVRFFMPQKNTEGFNEEAEDDSEEVELINDLEGSTATESDARDGAERLQTSSNSTRALKATDSNMDTDVATASDLVPALAFLSGAEQIRGSNQTRTENSRFNARRDSRTVNTSGVFINAYNTALLASSSGTDVIPGSDRNFSHCSDTGDGGKAWRIYDHRTEGEIHINKRDMELEQGQKTDSSGRYDSYGDSQGDGTLEGAVYGLFAAADIIHPDGTTGVVYKANNLVAIAATDKEGDASFMTYTEAPGCTYDYEAGMVVETGDLWAQEAPENLYTRDITYDDCTEDGQYKRRYYDNAGKNGSCWIGRPLLMGDYYIKELTRSEGYELSIGNKENAITNYGQDYNVSARGDGTGYAGITHNLFAEEQISPNAAGAYHDPDYNELFFEAESRGTGEKGFDLLFSNLPKGTRLYRLDTAIREKETEVGTGFYEQVPVTDAEGNPVYVTAEHNRQYLRYNPDGAPMTRTVPGIGALRHVAAVISKPLDAVKSQKALLAAEDGMTEGEVLAKLSAQFTTADLNFVKGKLERALRVNGKRTPHITSEDGVDYSSIYVGIYDTGVREGENDPWGVAGGEPGSVANRTVYGSPVIELTVNKTDSTGTPVTVGDILATLLDFYNTNGIYNYGGLDALWEEESGFRVTVYASRVGNPAGFFVPDSVGSDEGVAYKRVEYLPDDGNQSPRYIYADYASDSGTGAFGTYQNARVQEIGGSVFFSAALVTDAVADGTGRLTTKSREENIYYQTGEIPYGPDGNPIQKTEFQEQTIISTRKVQEGQYVEIPITDINGEYVAHIDSRYTDSYGVSHDDEAMGTVSFKLVLPDKWVTLTKADIEAMGSAGGWRAGDAMASAAYYLRARFAAVKAYLDYENRMVGGMGSFIQEAVLTYPGHDYPWQDGDGKPGTGTRVTPVGVQERAIKQTIKVTKQIEGFSGEENMDAAVDNFRFKAYLRSNLTRLYRDETGDVTWIDKKGTELAGNDAGVLAVKKQFPELVQKLFTKVPHRADSLYKDSDDAIIANTKLYSHVGELLNGEQNSGYTALLETVERPAEDKTGIRLVKAYNYKKFFDAIAVSNNDKWDDANPTYTSYQPIGNEANQTADAIENAKVSDQVRQFAIDWYLDDEVKKLTRPVYGENGERESAGGNISYSDELYDKALRAAIIKAENYLKPFFSYDLDEIYAIAWDSEAHGGADQDKTTLSADMLQEHTQTDMDGYYYGISAYLPYGTYVVVEQQPRYAQLGDFKNKHYTIDRPREVELPAVYESYAGSRQSPEVLSSYYRYQADMPLEEMAAKYQIRFHEENHVVYAHSHYGDFEVYKYGQDIDRLNNNIPEEPGAGDYFALTQAEYKPYKNYYNENDRHSETENPYYLTEGQSGRSGVSGQYHYSSVSEQAGTADDMMQGIQTAYNRKYAPMLVPYTVKTPQNVYTEAVEAAPTAYGASSYVGYGYAKFVDRPYTAKLRLEKLDSQTKENLLHDGAIFAIFAAKREDSADGEGRVLFYETDTAISGTKEFLEAMGAEDIRPVVRRLSWFDRLIRRQYATENLYTGVVSAGTPICEEEERIVLKDFRGQQTVEFKAYSTVRDGMMKKEDGNAGETYQLQTVGYLELPHTLSAGVYVICEMKAPAGYVRSKPVAVEIYSDKVTYYKEGKRDSRVLAAMYETEGYNQADNDSSPGDSIYVARVNIENAPIKLTVEKLKESSASSANTTADKTVTYKVSGRIDGKLADIGGNPEYVYAYENGDYLGYAWKKGTLEYLEERKAAGEQVELVYEGSAFAGYGYVTRLLDTAEDVNQYVVGATMTLFDAIPLNGSGDSEDHAYEGLVIERNSMNNVTRMYVEEGYAGEKVEFILDRDEKKVWSAVTVKRPDTDILYYDLDGLEVVTTEHIDGRMITYGYNRNHEKVPVEQAESDKANYEKTDSEHSLFAFKDGIPYLEFAGGDFTRISYSERDKVLTVSQDMKVYHLDRDGNRDALVDPYTGMAYVELPKDTERNAEEISGNGNHKQVMVWAVKLHRDEYGNIIARDKITTSRIATVGENKLSSYACTESGYITGSWRGEGGEESHHETSVNTNRAGHSMNEEVLVDDNNGSLKKELNPVFDIHGLTKYYQLSNEVYDKSTDLYDRNGDFVRQQDSDKLMQYNGAAYRINPSEELLDGDEMREGQARKKLYHRQGEAYILENTWVTSDKTPNDPFDNATTAGQADVLKRVPAGSYIMEELKSPAGYLKGMPTAIMVKETTDMQHAVVVDKTIKIEISKTDAPQQWQQEVIDCITNEVVDTSYEALSAFGYGSVAGAILALYQAEKVYTADMRTYPRGYYLKKTGTAPFKYVPTNSREGAEEEQTARWTIEDRPVYLEGIPEGLYLLEELSVPEGFVKAEPVEVEITSSPEVQSFFMADDHTRVEVEKYALDGDERSMLAGAGFTLFEARVDADGTILYENGKPQYDPSKKAAQWISGDGKKYRNFLTAFETMYREFGTTPGTSISWEEGSGVNHTAVYRSCEKLHADVSGGSTSLFPASAVMIFETDEGKRIRIGIHGQSDTLSGRDFTFEYQFEYQELPNVNAYANTYQTLEGRQRLEYLPEGGIYVLVETQTPEGYAKGEDVVVEVLGTAKVQRYAVENQEGMLTISKQTPDCRGELAGAQMALYRADANGNLVQTKEYLQDMWTTGEDGVYTELDFINGRIPDDYQQGDLKPHVIRRLPDGEYWLVEQKAPAYYTTFEPVKISYRQTDELRIQRVTDVPAKGELTIKKTDESGNPLSGAGFILEAYRKEERMTPVFTREISLLRDQVIITGLPIGEAKENGRMEPYLYKLKETTPPDGYAVNTEVFCWEFAPDKSGVSYAYGEMAKHKVRVVDKRTRVLVLKKDFYALEEDESEEAFVEGAHLAVYELTGRDDKGNPVYDQNNPIEVWITSRTEPEHAVEGLVCGKSYLLKEIKAPNGYYFMPDFIFTMSVDGNAVASADNGSKCKIIVTDKKTDVSLSKVDITNQEELPGCHMALLNETGTVIAAWISGTEPYRLHGVLNPGDSYILREIQPAEGYELAEEIHFTVNMQGRPQVVTMADKPIDAHPEKPDKPKPPKLEVLTIPPLRRIGKVIAQYEPQIPRAAGRLYLEPEGVIKIPLPGTGDGRLTVWYLGTFLSAFAAVALAAVKWNTVVTAVGRGRKRRKK